MHIRLKPETILNAESLESIYRLFTIKLSANIAKIVSIYQCPQQFTNHQIKSYILQIKVFRYLLNVYYYLNIYCTNYNNIHTCVITMLNNK